jgi:hypothetical protein
VAANNFPLDRRPDFMLDFAPVAGVEFRRTGRKALADKGSAEFAYFAVP